MKQRGLAATDFVKKPRQTRLEKFLLEMDAGSDTLPDGTTILDSATCRKPIASRPGCLPINALLAGKVLRLREGATIDATHIAAPPSTRNRDGRHDPEMSQTKKGKQWDFGMKAYIGVDDQSGLVHTVVGTTAKVSDMSQFGELLQGEEERVRADRGQEHPQIHAHLEESLIEDWVARKTRQVAERLDVQSASCDRPGACDWRAPVPDPRASVC